MDFGYPALIDALAKSRPIILLDNAVIGKIEEKSQQLFKAALLM
jgi:hypothetical protein